MHARMRTRGHASNQLEDLFSERASKKSTYRCHPSGCSARNSAEANLAARRRQNRVRPHNQKRPSPRTVWLHAGDPALGKGGIWAHLGFARAQCERHVFTSESSSCIPSGAKHYEIMKRRTTSSKPEHRAFNNRWSPHVVWRRCETTIASCSARWNCLCFRLNARRVGG